MAINRSISSRSCLWIRNTWSRRKESLSHWSLIALSLLQSDEYSTGKCYARSHPIWHYPKEWIRNIINWPRPQLVRIVKTKPTYLSAGAEIAASLPRRNFYSARRNIERLSQVMPHRQGPGRRRQDPPG